MARPFLLVRSRSSRNSVCSHCSSSFRSGPTCSKEAGGGGGVRDDGCGRRRRGGRDGDGDFGFGPTVAESVGAASGEEGGAVRVEIEGGREGRRRKTASAWKGGRSGRRDGRKIKGLLVCVRESV